MTERCCKTCRLLVPADHQHFTHECSWKMMEAAPSWLLASWRPTDREAVKYPDENWSARLRWPAALEGKYLDGITAPPIGHDCKAWRGE